ncbi:MAG: hypothetical protein ACOCUS_02715 [Polyangiales bacterium]
MTKRFVLAAVVLASTAVPTRGPAFAIDEDEPEGVSVRVTRWTPPTAGEAGPPPAARYLLLLEIAPDAWSKPEVVADRRLLELTVRPDLGKRFSPRLRCRHPDAPRRVGDERVRTLSEGETWREWLDLRMYCSVRARRMLDEHGGTVEVRYGFRYRGRDRWIARHRTEVDAESEAETETLRHIEGEDLSFEPAPEPERDPDAPVRIEMASRDSWSDAGLTFRVSVGSTEGTRRVYLRPDMWSFRVQGPLGEVTCGMPHQPLAPIVDFFDRITERREQREVLSASQLCPEGTFSIAGVYDVTPIVSLPYGGEQYDMNAVTGTYEGVPTPVRIRHDDRGYVEHPPEQYSAGSGGDEAADSP